MNDQLIYENYLLVLKSTVEVYVHGTLESENESVRDLLKTCLNSTISMQSNIFDKMAEMGWYKLENCKEKEIEKTITKLNTDN